jgi:branched-chain amino acid transport system permease protein
MTATQAGRAAAAAVMLALLTLPLWLGSTYYVNVASQVLFYAILALALNVLVGYCGLVSLGHAALFGIAAYAAALLLQAGFGQLAAGLLALVATLAAAAIFAVLSLRATGISFLMITLALGQIVWGMAYRWVSLTNGDNGIKVPARPHPFGLDLEGTTAFYYATLAVFALAFASMRVLVRSPLGMGMRGTRDQPRRMTALGYHVWLIRFVAFLISGFWCAIAGLLYLYYNKFVSPQVVTLQASAEALLMVISGGTATLVGPVAGAGIVVIVKSLVSARWNMVLGLIFVAIVVLMPEGLVPGTPRLARAAWRELAARRARGPIRTLAQTISAKIFMILERTR